MRCFAKLQGRRSGSATTAVILSHGFATDHGERPDRRDQRVDRGPATLLRLLPLLSLAVSVPALAQSEVEDAEQEIALSPQTLGEALSCQSHPALAAFGSALFMEGKPPSWMQVIKGEKATEGMIGLYGYKLSKPAAILGEPVTKVYFLGDWVVTLWPRAKVEAFIAAHKMQRAPIRITEQYYRFLDPETGPMLGAFEPTGGSTAAVLAKAFGASLPPSAPSDSLFVGCNYTHVTQAEFLKAARQSGGLMDDAARDISGLVDKEPAQ